MSLHERTSGTRTSITNPQSQWAEGKSTGIEELPVSSSVRQYDRVPFPRVASGDIAELHERLSSSRGSGTSADGVRGRPAIVGSLKFQPSCTLTTPAHAQLDQQMSAPKPERSWTVRVGERNHGQVSSKCRADAFVERAASTTSSVAVDNAWGADCVKCICCRVMG